MFRMDFEIFSNFVLNNIFIRIKYLTSVSESKNPFLQADNQVQQIVDKFLKTSDGKGNNLNKDKDNAISIEDIKISNIMREAEINDPPSSREEEPRNRYSTSDSEKRVKEL